MTGKFRKIPHKILALGMILLLSYPAVADTIAGTYRGFFAFEFQGEEVREWMMISFHKDGTLIMGAEESHDEPVDPDTRLVTRNDFESANLGLWREVGTDELEFGSQQYRAGSGACAPLSKQGGSLLPTCSFIFTAGLKMDVEVRGEQCDLGGVDGGFAVQSVDGTVTKASPFGAPLKMDYCLQRMSIDKFLELAPLN